MKLTRLSFMLATFLCVLSACGSKTELIAPETIVEPVQQPVTTNEPKEPGFLLD